MNRRQRGFDDGIVASCPFGDWGCCCMHCAHWQANRGRSLLRLEPELQGLESSDGDRWGGGRHGELSGQIRVQRLAWSEMSVFCAACKSENLQGQKGRHQVGAGVAEV